MSPISLSPGSQDESETRKRARTRTSKGATSGVASSKSKKKGKKEKLQSGEGSSFQEPKEPRQRDFPSSSRPAFFYTEEEKEAYSKIYRENAKVVWLVLLLFLSFLIFLFFFLMCKIS